MEELFPYCLRFIQIISFIELTGVTMKISIYFIVINIFWFCSDSSVDPQNGRFILSDTLQIKYQETLVNEEEEISIKFDELISDSRCPVDMMCF